MSDSRLAGTRIFERYEILSKIDSGGMAEVYLGQDLQHDKKVAIKILHESYSANKNFIARFQKEAQILVNLDNPNIVSVYDWGQSGNLYFIVMEYVSGESLNKLIERNGHLNPRQAAAIAGQVCDALAAAHSGNLIHRDIKPQNIIISDNDVVKLTDFGIAKIVADDLTKTMSILGTSHYVSPEQAQGKILDYRSDIYSLGIVMYEMLTGDVPFRGGSSIDISLRHISEKPVLPSKILPGIPEKIEKIVLKCLEKYPDMRYRDVTALKTDLNNFLEGRPLSEDSLLKNNRLKSKTTRRDIDLSHADKSFEKYYAKTKRLKTFLLSLTGAVFILFVVFLTLYLLSRSELKGYIDKSNIVKVPPVENLLLEDAKQIISAENLVLEVNKTQFNENIEADHIISQDPAFNTEIKSGDTVFVTLSKGREFIYVTIPNFTGFEKNSAVIALKEAGLKTGIISEGFNDYLASGIVSSQSPAPGEKVKSGTEVNLVLSKGREKITLPDLQGYDYSSAKSELESLGLNIKIEKQTSDILSPGTVIVMSPEAGAEVNKNDVIILTLSTKDQTIVVPNLVLMDFAQAEALLIAQNIGYEVSYITVDYSIQKNSVVSQLPEPGETISVSEKVIVFVGQ
jgi:eukaryotic-like serine/threonine-protein kinase